MKDMLPCSIGLDDLSNRTIGRGTRANSESQLLGVGSDSSAATVMEIAVVQPAATPSLGEALHCRSIIVFMEPLRNE